MARKPTKTTKSSKKRSTARRGKTTQSKRKTSTRGKSQSGSKPRRASTRKKPVSKPSPSQQSNLTGLSLDRKLDIVGVVLALSGLLTILGLLSANNSRLMGAWVSFLGRAVGWGLYILPLGMMSLGIWLILRNFEHLPKLSIERLAGLILLYTNILTIIHFSTFPDTRTEIFALAEANGGGGYLGGTILEFLHAGLGWGGTAIALLAWALIALALTMDVSVLELFQWIPPLILRIQDMWDDWRARRRKKSPKVTHLPPISLITETTSKSPLSSQTQSPSPPSLETPIQEWTLPPIEEILDAGDEHPVDEEYDHHRAKVIEETLASFGAPVHVVEINRGPTITQYGVEPDFIESRGKRTRVRVGKISALVDDLALALAATRIRIQAPVPGKGFVGIEVPNEKASLVALRDVIESKAFRQLDGRTLRFALGQDVSGNAVAADLAAMPHLLIAGTTGSGKSVCVNSLISSFLMHNTPDDLRMIMVDPKRVELTGYDGIPHLLAPVVVELERVVGALQWVSREMDQRYNKFAKIGARNINEFNKTLQESGERTLPHLVVIIDELADLMMLSPDETERTITRLAQLARATGIHLVISTQRPSVNVVTGLIKANFPARVAFAVASGVDSRVILDQPGAERLLGRGDMLFQAPDAAAPVRLQGVFVSDYEILRLVQYWRQTAGYITHSPSPTATGGIPDAIPASIPLKQMPLWEEMEAEKDVDPLLQESIDLVRRRGRASISMLQRRLRIGYTRGARLIETMEEKGIISAPKHGTHTREILDYGQAAPPVDED